MSFVQLHLHTDASILDGVGQIEKYVRTAKEFGMPGIAITDHGVLSNTLNFHRECRKAGINPILGSEFYVNLSEEQKKEEYERLMALGDSEEAKEMIEEDEEEDVESTSTKKHRKSLQSAERKYFHQIVLVKNEEGWKNVCKMNYFSFLKQTDKLFDKSKGEYYYKPRITREFLFELKNGVVVTSSCMASEINRYIMHGNIQKAYELVELYKKNFGADFYIELQFNEINTPEVSQIKINEELIKIADALNIKVILTGDVHYNFKGDDVLQDAIIAINQRTTIYDEKAFKLHARSLYFHSRDDYHRLSEEFGFNYAPEFIDKCLDTTLEINEKCDFDFNKKKSYPRYSRTQEESVKKIKELCRDALQKFIIKKNLSKEQQQVYIDRLKYELGIINKNGYTDYFLTLWDLVEHCNKIGIRRGVSRGSVTSSLTAFLLDISKVDPIKYGLFFERFMNEEAMATPDADLDFCSDRRDEAIEYLKQKWGEDCVVRVGNFNTFNVRGGLKDLVRVFDRSWDDIEFLCNENKGNIDTKLTDETIDAWFEQYEDMNDAREKRIYKWYTDNKDIVEWFKKIYGSVRNVSQHAGGVVITPEPIYNFIPVNRSKNVLITGYPEADAHKDLSELGLLKYDILGLSTVSIIDQTIKLIKEKRGIDVTEQIDDIDLENPELYKEFSKGENFLVFQFESEGMSALIKQSNPQNIYDVSCVNANNRPGPLNSGAAYEWAKCCFGSEEPRKIHPLIDPILEETRGVISYQEQITLIINACTGISLGKAEKIRKSIEAATKVPPVIKYPELFEEFKETFVELAMKNGIEQDVAEYIKEYLLSSAGYLFNKSHSIPYSIGAMQTIWLKIYYPAEFYAVNLSRVKDEKEFGLYIGDALRRGVLVSEPDVLHSEYSFTTKDDKTIVCGLNILKGLGNVAYRELVNSGRKFTNIVEFLSYDWKKLNKKCLEVLAKSGSLKSLEENTKVVLELIAYHLENKKNLNKTDRKGNVKYSLENLQQRYDELMQMGMKDYTENEYLQLWKEATGFSNPFKNRFAKYLGTFAQYGIVSLSAWKDISRYVYGEITSREELFTKNDKPYTRVRISDGFNENAIVIWDNHMRKNDGMRHGLQPGNVVCIELDKDNFGFKYRNDGRFILVEGQ